MGFVAASDKLFKKLDYAKVSGLQGMTTPATLGAVGGVGAHQLRDEDNYTKEDMSNKLWSDVKGGAGAGALGGMATMLALHPTGRYATRKMFNEVNKSSFMAFDSSSKNINKTLREKTGGDPLINLKKAKNAAVALGASEASFVGGAKVLNKTAPKAISGGIKLGQAMVKGGISGLIGSAVGSNIGADIAQSQTKESDRIGYGMLGLAGSIGGAVGGFYGAKGIRKGISNMTKKTGRFTRPLGERKQWVKDARADLKRVEKVRGDAGLNVAGSNKSTDQMKADMAKAAMKAQMAKTMGEHGVKAGESASLAQVSQIVNSKLNK